jgi:hypothetical protein
LAELEIALALGFQAILTRWDGCNRELPARVAGSTPFYAGFPISQSDSRARHAVPALVCNHPSEDARD